MRCCPLIMADEPNLAEGYGWHTTRTTLAMSAYLDWRARLNELHETGLRIESLVHWSRGVEVQHVPPNIQRPLECDGALPPPLVAACVDSSILPPVPVPSGRVPVAGGGSIH